MSSCIASRESDHFKLSLWVFKQHQRMNTHPASSIFHTFWTSHTRKCTLHLTWHSVSLKSLHSHSLTVRLKYRLLWFIYVHNLCILMFALIYSWTLIAIACFNQKTWTPSAYKFGMALNSNLADELVYLIKVWMEFLSALIALLYCL